MEIILSDKYKLRSDAYNYILERKSDTNHKLSTGKETWSVIGYYSTLERLTKGLLEHEIKLSEAEHLSALVQLVCDIERDITKKLNKLQD